MRPCPFCKINSRESDIIYKDAKTVVTFDKHGTVKGHTLVIAKRHVTNLSDLTEDEYLHFSRVVYHVEKALLKLLRVDKSVILKSGGLVPHFHFHIYPVHADTPWEMIKDVFDRKVRYLFVKGERKQFAEELKREIEKRLKD